MFFRAFVRMQSNTSQKKIRLILMLKQTRSKLKSCIENIKSKIAKHLLISFEFIVCIANNFTMITIFLKQKLRIILPTKPSECNK